MPTVLLKNKPNGSRPVFSGYSRKAQALYAATGGTQNIGTYYAGLTNGGGASAATLAAAPADLQSAGLLSWLKGLFGDKEAAQSQNGKVISTGTVITPDGINVRKGSGTSFGKVTAIPKGSTFEIIGGICYPDKTSWLKIRLPNGTEGFVSENPKWISTSNLKNVPIVNSATKEINLPKPVYIPGEYSLAGDEAVRKSENHILNTIVKNPPVSGLNGAWIATLGSGAHDNPAFHALDLGMGSNADKGKDVIAVENGTISKIDLSYGSVMINHPKGKDTPAWQSNYLHMPLYKAVDPPKEPEVTPTDRLTKDEKQIYVLHTPDTVDKEGNFIEGTEIKGFEIWEGMEVKTGDKIGVIDGRGPSSKGDAGLDEAGKAISEDSLPDHLHFETRLNGKTINMALAAQNGWGATVTAMGGGVRNVIWSNKVDIGNLGGAWVNDSEKLIFFRDPAITADTLNDYWKAWEKDVPVGDMKMVVEKTLPEAILSDGSKVTNYTGWIHTDADGLTWEWKAREWGKITIP